MSIWKYRQGLRDSRRQEEKDAIEEFVQSGKARKYDIKRGPQKRGTNYLQKIIEKYGPKYRRPSGHVLNLYDLVYHPYRCLSDPFITKRNTRFHFRSRSKFRSPHKKKGK